MIIFLFLYLVLLLKEGINIDLFNSIVKNVDVPIIIQGGISSVKYFSSI